MPELTDRQREMLTFERTHPAAARGTREQQILERFGVSAARYYVELSALLDTQAALAAEPALVRRLQSARLARARTRRHGHRVS